MRWITLYDGWFSSEGALRWHMASTLSFPGDPFYFITMLLFTSWTNRWTVLFTMSWQLCNAVEEHMTPSNTPKVIFQYHPTVTISVICQCAASCMIAELWTDLMSHLMSSLPRLESCSTPLLRLHDSYLTELSCAFPKGCRLERISAKPYVWQAMKISDNRATQEETTCRSLISAQSPLGGVLLLLSLCWYHC